MIARDDDVEGCLEAMFYSKHALRDILSASYAHFVIMLMMTRYMTIHIYNMSKGRHKEKNDFF